MRRIKIRGVPSVNGAPPAGTAERILATALDRFARAIREIDVALVDINGPRGGRDKRCRTRVSLAPRGTVVVEGDGESYLEAVHSAAELAKRALQRHAGRRRTAVRRRAA